jgi:hypothetical protein
MKLELNPQCAEYQRFRDKSSQHYAQTATEALKNNVRESYLITPQAIRAPELPVGSVM